MAEKIKLKWLREKAIIFDVESVGLHGEGFAVSMVVTNNLEEISHVTWACLPDPAMSLSSYDDFKWVQENVSYPPDTIWVQTPRDVRNAFWAQWLRLKADNYVLCADVCWPVEANFLSECVRDDRHVRKFEGPYPLIDLSPILKLAAPSPVYNGRLKEHQPAHNPLMDCQHSLRQLRHIMNRLSIAFFRDKTAPYNQSKKDGNHD